MFIQQKCFSFGGTSFPRPPTGASPLGPAKGLQSPRPPLVCSEIFTLNIGPDYRCSGAAAPGMYPYVHTVMIRLRRFIAPLDVNNVDSSQR